MCVCVCALPQCISQSSSISHQSVAHRHGKPYSLSCSSFSLWQTNRSYRRQAEEPRVFDMTFFLVSSFSLSLSLFAAECCLCLALFKFNFKLQVASCQLPVANQSVRQPDCTTDTSVRSSLNQLGGGGAQLNDQSKPTQTLHFLCIKPTAATTTKAA